MPSLVFSKIDHDMLWPRALLVQTLLLVYLELVVQEISSRLSFAHTVGARCLTNSIAVLTFTEAASSPRHIIIYAITIGSFIGFASVRDLVVLGIHLVDLRLLGIHVEDLLLVLFLLSGQILDDLIIGSLDLIKFRDDA